MDSYRLADLDTLVFGVESASHLSLLFVFVVLAASLTLGQGQGCSR